MLIAVLAAVFGLCFCIFNWWFQKEKYNRMTRDELLRQNKLNAPHVWLSLSIFLFLLILGIISYCIYKYYIAIMKLQ